MEYRSSVSGILEVKNKLLMVREEDGWGLPSGRLEDMEPSYYGLMAELKEECSIYLEAARLWGMVWNVHPKKIMTGYIYKASKWDKTTLPITDQDVIEHQFLDAQQICRLMAEGKVRKPDYNLPVLMGWLGDWRCMAWVNLFIRGNKYSYSFGPSWGNKRQE